jgi:hypothetical protein
MELSKNYSNERIFRDPTRIQNIRVDRARKRLECLVRLGKLARIDCVLSLLLLNFLQCAAGIPHPHFYFYTVFIGRLTSKISDELNFDTLRKRPSKVGEVFTRFFVNEFNLK